VANTLSSGGTADVAGPSSAGVGKLWTASVTFGAKSLTFNFPNGAEDPIFQAVASGNTPLPSGPVTSGPITQAPGPIAGSGLGALALLGIAALLMRRRRLQA